MTISAVVPTYNRAKYLRRSLDSIFEQTRPVDEVVVIDDGSTDDTVDLIRAHYGNRVRLISQARAGVSGARLRGVQEAHGAWIAFLDSDDQWHPDRTRELAEVADTVPEQVSWIFGDLNLITDEGCIGTLFGTYGLELSDRVTTFEDSLAIQFPFQFCMLQGSLIRRQTLLSLECFSAGLSSDDDLLAGFQVATKSRFVALKSIVGSYYRTSDLGASSVVVNGNFRPDYYRSRLLAFASVINSGRRTPWNAHYAAHVRALCLALAKEGANSRGLAFEQFRYGGVSTKGLAFCCFAVAGRTGLDLWNRLAGVARRASAIERSSATPRPLGV